MNRFKLIICFQIDEIVGVVLEVFKWFYVYGFKMMVFVLLVFVGIGLIVCLLCENIDVKMNDKIEVFLENDIYVEKNEFYQFIGR